MDTKSYIWITGGMLVVIGLIGLKIASGAHGSTLYWLGLGVFVVTVLGVFQLIKRSFDEKH